MPSDRQTADTPEESPLPPGSTESSAFESLIRRVAHVPGTADLVPAIDLSPGLLVADRFELVREIGRGGFARVFEAQDRVLLRPVAIKFLKRRRRLNDSELELFYREARATARLNHPSIVTAHDWGVWNETPFLVLELLDGESLQHALERGPFDESRSWEIVAQIAAALAYAHGQGVLHLDLKTQNVVILRDGRVKVLDFGLAGLDWGEDVPGSVARVAGGTPASMAPEQRERTGTDARTDLWALGVILHQLVFGRLPEKLSPDATRIAAPPGASATVARVLARTLRRDRADRYPTAAALLEDIGRTPSTRSRRWIAPSVLLLALLALAIWSFLRGDVAARNPLSGARFRTLTAFEGTEHSAALSRDGNLAAFVSRHEGQDDVWVTRIGTGQFENRTRGRVPEPLSNSEIRTLQLTPDGSDVVFWAGVSDVSHARRIGLWKAPVLGGEPQPFLDGVAEIAWSSDGRQRVFHTPGPGDPMFIQPEAGTPRLLYTAPPPQHAHYQIWSPDDRWIYFVRGHPSEAMDLWRIRPSGGEPERLTFHDARVSHPIPLDGSTVLYLAGTADGSGPWVHLLDVERRTTRRVSDGIQRYTSLSVSGDGRRLVATADHSRRSLWRMELADAPVAASAASRITLPTAQGRRPRLGSDFLLYVSSDGETEHLWRLVGKSATELWSSRDARVIGGPAIAPGTGRIAFSIQENGQTRLVVMNADGTGRRDLAEGRELRGQPEWSPDGTAIVTAMVEAEKPRLFKISVESGATVPLVDEYSLDPAWAPDGRFVVYSGTDVGTTFPLRAVTATGEAHALPERLTLSRGPGTRRLRFIPGRNVLLALRGDIGHRDLWTWDLATNALRRVTKLGREIVIGDFDVSPDGREVVFERIEENSDVVLIDLAPR
ncbi:MAG TPA: protein kinase [Myxococcaceae bacterium]|nr:protein kinase [Myxococcaceae bacterium]